MRRHLNTEHLHLITTVHGYLKFPQPARKQEQKGIMNARFAISILTRKRKRLTTLLFQSYRTLIIRRKQMRSTQRVRQPARRKLYIIIPAYAEKKVRQLSNMASLQRILIRRSGAVTKQITGMNALLAAIRKSKPLMRTAIKTISAISAE